MFHVLYLELYVQQEDNDEISKLSLSELMNRTEEYEVKEILDKQQKKDELWYKIRWKSYSSKYNQWIQKKDMKNAQELQQQFDIEIQTRKRSWKQFNKWWLQVNKMLTKQYWDITLLSVRAAQI